MIEPKRKALQAIEGVVVAGEYLKVSVYNSKNIRCNFFSNINCESYVLQNSLLSLTQYSKKSTLNSFYQDESEILFHAFISPKLDQFAKLEEAF